MIERVEIVNWRSHKNTTLEFSEGTNVFIGIMGSGKSSVFDAITYAFYGRFPKSDRREVKLSDVIRFGEKNGEVKVWFSANGKRYMVVRGVGSDRAELYEIVDDEYKLIQKDKNRVTNSVVSLLGTDYSLFTRAIYSEQNNMDYFLTLPPSKRKEELDRLLGIDKFYKVLSNTTTVIHRLENRLKDLKMNYSEESVKELENKINVIKEEVDKVNRDVQKLNKEKVALIEKLKEENRVFEEIKKKREMYQNLKDKYSTVVGKLENLKKQFEKVKFDAKEYTLVKDEYNQLKEKIDSLKKKYDEKRKMQKELYATISTVNEKIKRLAEVNDRIKSLKQEIQTISEGKSLKEIEDILHSMEERMQSLKNESYNSKQKIKELKEMMAQLKPGMGKCPLCGTELSDQHINEIKSEKEKEIERLNNRIKEINDILAKLKDEHEILKKKMNELEKKKVLLENLIKETDGSEKYQNLLAKYDEKYKDVVDEIKRIEDELVKYNDNEKELLSKMKDMEYGKQIMEEFKRSKQYLEMIKQKINDLNYDEKMYLISYERIKELEKNIEKLDVEIKGLENIRTEKLHLLNTYQKEYDTMLTMKKKADEYEKKVLELKKFKNAMSETIVELRNYIVNALNIAVEELWPHIYPYQDYKGIMVDATEKDYNLLIHVKDKGWINIEQVVSGGERMCAALVFRIALAIVLTPNLSWLVLDEPTHNLDSDAVELMAIMLEEKIPSVVKQTFVITHDESLLNHEYSRIYLFKRDKEKGEPTSVERIR